MRKFFKFRKRVRADVPPAKEHERSELTVYLVQFLRRRTWLILFVSVLGSGLIALGTYLCIPEYKASVKIVVQSSTDQQILLFDDLHRPVLRGLSVIPANNIIEMATSELHARTMVEEFRLDEELRRQDEAPANVRETFWAHVTIAKRALKRAVKYPYVLYSELTTGKKPRQGKTNYRNRALAAFLSDITDIELVAESDVIKLSIWWTKPREAEAMAKRLAELVVGQFVQLQQAAAGHGYEICSEQLAKARDELTLTEQKLQDFRGREMIGDLNKQRDAKLAQLHETEKGMLAAESELAAVNAELTESEKQHQEGRKMLSSLQSYQSMQSDLIKLRVKVSSLTARLKEYAGARDQASAELARLTGLEQELHALVRERELKERLVIQLAGKQNELAVQKASDLSRFNLQLIDVPDLPENARAAWPDWLLNLCIGIPASVIIAVGFALLLHLWSDPFWTRLKPQDTD